MLTEKTKKATVKSSLCEYIREAEEMLDPSLIPDEKCVHDVRVLLKKARASLKLLEALFDIKSYEREYAALREAGRLMGSWRESSVNRKLLKGYKKKYPEIFVSLADNEKISGILAGMEKDRLHGQDSGNELERIISILHRSLYRIRFHRLDEGTNGLVFSGLTRSFDTVSAYYMNARLNPKSRNLHNFRKKNKDLLYQLYFFREPDPQAVRRLEKKVESLARLLGKYNDNAVLLETIGYRFSPGKIPDSLDLLAVRIKQEQDGYLNKIWPLAFSLFRPGQKPGDLPGLKDGFAADPGQIIINGTVRQ